MAVIQHFPQDQRLCHRRVGCLDRYGGCVLELCPPLGVCVAHGLWRKGDPARLGCTVILLYVSRRTNMDHCLALGDTGPGVRALVGREAQGRGEERVEF